MLQPIAEPLYFTAVYPKGGSKILKFWEPPPKTGTARLFDLAVSNVWCRPLDTPEGPQGESYYHLPHPQQFHAYGIAMRPAYGGLRWEDAVAAYAGLRANATYRLKIGSKSYSEGPLDHILSWSGDPTREDLDLSKFLRLDVPPEMLRAIKDGKPLPLHIPPAQKFGLDVMVRQPWVGEWPKLEDDLPLRAYLIGVRWREVC